MKQENEVSACVRHALTEYFKRLDGAKPSPIYEMVIRSVEKPMLQVVLDYTGGNQTKAAAVLGLNRNTLRKKMIEYGIE
jgi:Fis family transcriptional regulator, factor for inversion stimulation protein